MRYKYLFVSCLILGNVVAIPAVSAIEEESNQSIPIEKVDEKIMATTTESFMERYQAMNEINDQTTITSSTETSTEVSDAKETKEQEIKNENSTDSDEKEIIENKQLTESVESNQEDSKCQAEISNDTQSSSYSGTPRYSVGQTVDLMDQNTKERWNITIEKDFYQVNQYLGTHSTDIVTPTEMNIVLTGTRPTKKKVRLNGGSNKFMQNGAGAAITSFKVEGNNEVLVNGVEAFNNFFRNSSIQSVDLTGLNVNVISSIDMSSMFQGCTRLSNVKFGANNFNNVTNTSRMFSGCTSLESVDLSMWNTNKNSINMSYMFENTPALRRIDLRNLALDNQNTLEILGTPSTNHSAVNQPLAVIVNATTASRFLQFDFARESGRVPESFPVLDANGGQFSSGQSRLKYIDKICVTPEQLELSTFNTWKNNHLPSKTGTSFSQWTPSRSEGSPTSVFDLLGIIYTKYINI